jgi:hypothetical protein
VPGTGVVENGDMSKHHKNIINYRKLYESHFGEIPKGYHIHHIDGNPYNNDISNLKAVSAEEHAIIHNQDFVKYAMVGGKLGGEKAKKENLGFFSATSEQRKIWSKKASLISNEKENIEKRIKTYKKRFEDGTIKHWTEYYSKEEIHEKITSGDPGKSQRGKIAWNKGKKMVLSNIEEINKKKSISALNRKKYSCEYCDKQFDKGNLVKHLRKCNTNN